MRGSPRHQIARFTQPYLPRLNIVGVDWTESLSTLDKTQGQSKVCCYLEFFGALVFRPREGEAGDDHDQ